MFGKKLKELRKKADLTQKELADALGLSAAAIGLYEQNRRSPDIELLEKISRYFNVSTDYLIGISNSKNISKEETNIETKAYHNLDVGGLSEEAIKQIEDYIEFVKQKYNPDGTLKKK